MTPDEALKRHQDFLEWKRDLERRLEEHLKANPEPIKKPQSLLPKWACCMPPLAKPPLFIQILESQAFKGHWVVWVNDSVDRVFTGPTAHARAIRYAVQLQGSKDEVVGDPCVYCGARSGHREDCPELDRDSTV